MWGKLQCDIEWWFMPLKLSLVYGFHGNRKCIHTHALHVQAVYWCMVYPSAFNLGKYSLIHPHNCGVYLITYESLDNVHWWQTVVTVSNGVCPHPTAWWTALMSYSTGNGPWGPDGNRKVTLRKQDHKQADTEWCWCDSTQAVLSSPSPWNQTKFFPVRCLPVL